MRATNTWRLALVPVWILLIASGCHPQARAAEVAARDGERIALWQALDKALPQRFERIDVYGETPALDAILFRSQGRTLLFRLKDRQLGEVPHMATIGLVNRISFESRQGGGQWILWLNGRPQATIDPQYETAPLPEAR